MNYILSEEQLKSLLKSKVKLEALQYGGVDNWDYYCDAIHEHPDYDDDECEFNVDKYLFEYEKVGEQR